MSLIEENKANQNNGNLLDPNLGSKNLEGIVQTNEEKVEETKVKEVVEQGTAHKNNVDENPIEENTSYELSGSTAEIKKEDTEIQHPNSENDSNLKLILNKIIKNKWIYIAILGAISILVFVITLLNVLNGTNKQGSDLKNKVINAGLENKQVIEQKINVFTRKIDGVIVENEKDSNKWPITVIIENSVDARPLSGINEANVIYEALAESSITRFLCIYADGQKINKIGPVRSARPYYAEIAEEYNPLFVHFGGSPEALDNIKNGAYNLSNLDGIIYDGKYLWREKKRVAPHNAYTSSELLNAYIEKIDKKDFQSDFTSWIFNTSVEKYSSEKVANNVLVEYNDKASLYNVKWVYNPESGNYTRYYANGSKDYDSENNEIKTNNIVIQFVSSEVVDEVGRKKVNLTEGGKAIMIRDGIFVEGYWKKNYLLSRTKFYFKDKNNQESEFEFKPGKIWINILPKEYKFKID